MLINIKMPTLIGILTFMIMINSMLICFEQEQDTIYNLRARNDSDIQKFPLLYSD